MFDRFSIIITFFQKKICGFVRRNGACFPVLLRKTYRFFVKNEKNDEKALFFSKKVQKN
jgi:hypothetical protein